MSYGVITTRARSNQSAAAAARINNGIAASARATAVGFDMHTKDALAACATIATITGRASGTRRSASPNRHAFCRS